MQTFKLNDCNRSVNIGQIVFKTRLDNFSLRFATEDLTVKCINGQTVEFQRADFIRQLVVVRGYQATFSTGHIFDGVEGENCRSLCANPAVTVTGTCRVRSIFHYRNTVFVGDSVNRVQV